MRRTLTAKASSPYTRPNDRQGNIERMIIALRSIEPQVDWQINAGLSHLLPLDIDVTARHMDKIDVGFMPRDYVGDLSHAVPLGVVLVGEARAQEALRRALPDDQDRIVFVFGPGLPAPDDTAPRFLAHMLESLNDG